MALTRWLREVLGYELDGLRLRRVSGSLPDHYTGELNKQRIKQYRMTASKYGVKEDIAMHIFCEGADWYKRQVEGNVR